MKASFTEDNPQPSVLELGLQFNPDSDDERMLLRIFVKFARASDNRLVVSSHGGGCRVFVDDNRVPDADFIHRAEAARMWAAKRIGILTKSDNTDPGGDARVAAALSSIIHILNGGAP